MNTALNIVNNGAVSELDKVEIDKQIEGIISKHKNNRYEINKLVLGSVSALTASENYSNELASKGAIKRFWGGITGKNKELQSKIDNNLAAAQYASQQTLQRLAEQNLMSFELITVVNNKLNASMLEVEKEINNIYGTLVTFFKKTKSDIIQLENRVERLERNVNLLNWQNSIEYQMWNGMEYVELDTFSKIVCMVRDFYDITKGEWTTSDLLLLKSAMSIIGINPRELINCGAFIRALYMNRSLCEKLFQGKMNNEYVEEWYVALASATNKGISLQEKESYIVQGVMKCLAVKDIKATSEAIVDNLVEEYEKNEIFMSPQSNVLAYDLMIELLFNLEQLKYIPPKTQAERLKEAEIEHMKENYEVAFYMFKELAEENCGRAMFFLGEYYKQGYGNILEINDTNTAIGHEWHKKGAKYGDVLAELNTSYMYSKDSVERKSIQERIYPQVRMLADQGDMIAQNELSDICNDKKEKIYWLQKSAEAGLQRSKNKLRDLYYNLGVDNYGKNKTEEEYFCAIQYFMKAMDLGSADAMGYIGLMYDWGYGFAENTQVARSWYKRGAENGSAFSMRNYAGFLYEGRGGNMNKEEAKEWYIKSAELGLEDAKVHLKEKFGIEI